MFGESALLSVNYSLVNTMISKQIDAQISAHGINFSEFMILFHLSRAKDNMLRRIELAEKIGLSASGITRLVTPMEKIGLVQKEANVRDARVSLVKITTAGQRIFEESAVSFNAVSEQIFSKIKAKDITRMLGTLNALGGSIT